MNISNLQYVSDEKGDCFAVIVPIELWQELTSKNDLDSTAVIVPIELWEELTENNIDATEELSSIAGFESAFKKANRQVEEGKTKNWRSIRSDV